MCGIDRTIEPENLETYLADQMAKKKAEEEAKPLEIETYVADRIHESAEAAIAKQLAELAAQGMVLAREDVYLDHLDIKRNEELDENGNVGYVLTGKLRLSEYFFEKQRKRLGIE